MKPLVSLEVVPRSIGLEWREGRLLRQALAYVLIGGSAALGFVTLSTVVIGYRPPAPEWVTSVLCYMLFILPVYLLHRRFSFGSSAAHAQALPRYALVQGVSAALAAMFSFVAYHMAGLPPLSASVLVIAATSSFSFLVLKAWAFAAR